MEQKERSWLTKFMTKEKPKTCEGCAYLEDIWNRFVRLRPDLKESIGRLLEGYPADKCWFCRRGMFKGMALSETKRCKKFLSGLNMSL